MHEQALRICVAGISGWVGRELGAAVLDAEDLRLTGAISRSTAGQDVGALLGRGDTGLRIADDVEEALAAPTDVLIDYTAVDSVGRHVHAAIDAGVHVVVGTSGLTAEDYAEIDARARARSVGVVASGNFSFLAAALSHAAQAAATLATHWEVIDFAGPFKPDAPSGTARELAERLYEAAGAPARAPAGELQGPPEVRGAVVGEARVHSVRLPGFVVSTHLMLGRGDQRLTLAHEAGESPDPYVEGALVAARRVSEITGLVRGLDRLIFPGKAG